MTDLLIDRIYESAALPDLWEETLQHVAERVGGIGGLLFVLRDAKTRCIASPGARALWEGFVAEGWLERNSRAERLLRLDHAGWVHDLFDLTPAEARIARAVADLQSPAEIARACGVSRETVRTQIKTIYAKTGLGSQAALARLVAAVGEASAT